MPYLEEYGFLLAASVILRLKKSDPHEIGVVVNDEQAIAQSMRGRHVH
jgi:hypothetical protein